MSDLVRNPEDRFSRNLAHTRVIIAGTTYSCVGVYHAVTGNVDILETQEKHQCIPSVVAFR